MYFVGLDLAWGEKNQSGVAVLDGEGHLLTVTAAITDSQLIELIKPYVARECIVAIDAPLIVPNAKGYRLGETLSNRDFAPFQAVAQPSHRGNPLFDPPRGAVLANALGLDMDPSSATARKAIEVFPHAASISLFRLGRILKYKRRNRDAAHRKSELMRLVSLIEGLESVDPPLYVAGQPDWTALRARAASAVRPFQLNACEDPIDAVLCAYVALYSVRRPADVTVYGDATTGYILSPSLPDDLVAQRADPRPPVPAVARTAVSDYQARRPALVAATERYVQLVTALLDDAGINYLSITARTKTVESFAAKAERTVDGQRLFTDPLVEITDQVGLRVITYLREDVDAVATLIADEMRLIDDRDMGLETAREGRWGYASRHLLVGVEGQQQPASIQVRTVLQHAWAEFEHDIRYKGSIPAEHVPDLDRRFSLAAGLLELADREFTAIRERLRIELTDEEMTADESDPSDPRISTAVLATYLGNRYADAGWSRTDHYGWISGLLLELGVTSLDELTALLDGLDTDAINAAMAYRFPAGAVRRLDDALLAVFGERYLRLHGNAHRVELLEQRLHRLAPALNPSGPSGP